MAAFPFASCSLFGRPETGVGLQLRAAAHQAVETALLERIAQILLGVHGPGLLRYRDARPWPVAPRPAPGAKATQLLQALLLAGDVQRPGLDRPAAARAPGRPAPAPRPAAARCPAPVPVAARGATVCACVGVAENAITDGLLQRCTGDGDAPPAPAAAQGRVGLRHAVRLLRAATAAHGASQYRNRKYQQRVSHPRLQPAPAVAPAPLLCSAPVAAAGLPTTPHLTISTTHRRSTMTGMRTFLKSGHAPTLFAAFLYFDFCFAVWVLNGAMAPFISEAYQLNAAQKGFMISVPILAGALMRFPLGVLAQYIGRKNAAAGRDEPDRRRDGLRLPLRRNLRRCARDGRAAGHRRRQLRRGAVAGLGLVPAAAQGPGHGHRGRRQFGHRAGRAVCAAAGPGFGWQAVYGLAGLCHAGAHGR